jgi:hypothetical protein
MNHASNDYSRITTQLSADIGGDFTQGLHSLGAPKDSPHR